MTKKTTGQNQYKSDIRDKNKACRQDLWNIFNGGREQFGSNESTRMDDLITDAMNVVPLTPFHQLRIPP